MTNLQDVLCVENRPGPCGLVIFGASGDLTHRKLIPSLFALKRRGLLPERFFVLGFARTPLSHAQFRASIANAVAAAVHSPADQQLLQEFCQQCYYMAGSYRDDNLFVALERELANLEAHHQTAGNRVFYLSTPPQLYGPIARNLHDQGLTRQPPGQPWRRVVVEKPFGRSLASARQLAAQLHAVLTEDQLYRIDHYMGKETVQNILMFRFANPIFEPLWNSHYIDQVQITAAENIGVGHRAGYYESFGVLRDMFQNHMLQLLALVAMEPPLALSAPCVRDEIAKLLRGLRPFDDAQQMAHRIVRGQYTRGTIDGKTVPAYRQEHDVPDNSSIETYAAGVFYIDNWRWHGVPFYLRSGKRLRRKLTEIAITFKKVPHSIFPPLDCEHLPANVLVLHVQPNEGISLSLQAKRPGAKACMGTLNMDFDYREAFGGEPPEAYERLLLDVMLGDQMLFVRADTIDLAWQLLDPVLEQWAEHGASHPGMPLQSYAAGSLGPAAADQLLRNNGHSWRTL